MISTVKCKCRTCIHCDIENLICRPNSKDCKSEYILDKEDLEGLVCEFYESKSEGKDAYTD